MMRVTEARQPLSPPLLTLREGMNVLLARTQEIQKGHAGVLAGLANAQEREVIF